MPTYRIKRIRKTGVDPIGDCDVCGQSCDASPYIQHRREKGRRELKGSLIGHADCLKTGNWQYAAVVD